jgi:hypothetical protein
MATVFTAYTASAYAAPASAMAEEWSVSIEAILVGISLVDDEDMGEVEEGDSSFEDWEKEEEV